MVGLIYLCGLREAHPASNQLDPRTDQHTDPWYPPGSKESMYLVSGFRGFILVLLIDSNCGSVLLLRWKLRWDGGFKGGIGISFAGADLESPLFLVQMTKGGPEGGPCVESDCMVVDVQIRGGFGWIVSFRI